MIPNLRLNRLARRFADRRQTRPDVYHSAKTCFIIEAPKQNRRVAPRVESPGCEPTRAARFQGDAIAQRR